MVEAREGRNREIPHGIWDLVRGHILTHSQSQHIAFGVAWEQQGFLDTYQVLPSVSLSSCHTNDISHVVLSLSVEVDTFNDSKGHVLPIRELWLIFSVFLTVGALDVRRAIQWAREGGALHQNDSEK